MTNPIFLVRDPEIFNRIAIKHFDSFEDHKFLFEPEMDTLMGESLFLMRGQTWREMRVTLSPAFTGSKMRYMFGLMRECAIQTRDNLLEDPNRVEHEIDVGDFFSRYVTDIIVSCAFGLKVNSFKDRTNVFLETGKIFASSGSLPSFLKILMLRSMPWLMKKLDIEFFRNRTRRFFSDLLLDNFKKRKELNICRPDLVDLLMNAKRKNLFSADKANPEETSWSDMELVAQVTEIVLKIFLGSHIT